ncbi:MAG: TetR/AcrR family transcriptional regulator [Hyphomonadaceae bacterium]|nr:TetR/AcrR family transcriptional regulator [Hyphomonadaceae bacterium]
MNSRKITTKGEAVDTLEPARQTQAERRETAERAILEAATTIVAERGLNALTLHEAGEAAGYSRALPAHYFGTKSAMVSALADYIIDGYTQRIRDAVGSADGLDPLCERISFYFDDAERDPVTARAFQGILSAGLTRSELAPIVERLNRDSVDSLAGIIKLARDKGEIRADVRPRAEASLILASMRGVMFQWLTVPDHVSLSRMRDALVTNIRRSLAR